MNFRIFFPTPGRSSGDVTNESLLREKVKTKMLTRVISPIKRSLAITQKMADLNLKNVRAAYRGREEGLNDNGEFYSLFYKEYYAENRKLLFGFTETSSLKG